MVDAMVPFVVFDVRRCRVAEYIVCADVEVARAEFASWYNMIVRPDRWEGRKLGRFFLMLDGDGGSAVVMSDEDVRLDAEYFRFCDPPHDARSEAELAARIARLDALDAARLLARGNEGPEFFNGKRYDAVREGDAGSAAAAGAAAEVPEPSAGG